MKLRPLAAVFAALLAVTAAAAGTASVETLKNLNITHQGEANAHNRYEVFAKQADAEGCKQIAKLFRAIATAEATHDATHQRAILKYGGVVESAVIAPVPPGTTIENLKQVVAGETYERDTMYPAFLKLAEKEQADDAILAFKYAGAVEREHAAFFTKALAQFGHNAEVDYYVCPVCGETEAGAPDLKRCPGCDKPTHDFVKVL